MEALLPKIAQIAPKGAAELERFINETYESQVQNHKLDLKTLSIDLMLGMVLAFFQENAIEFSVSETNLNRLEDEVLIAFSNFEQVIGHYS